MPIISLSLSSNSRKFSIIPDFVLLIDASACWHRATRKIKAILRKMFSFCDYYWLLHLLDNCVYVADRWLYYVYADFKWQIFLSFISRAPTILSSSRCFRLIKNSLLESLKTYRTSILTFEFGHIHTVKSLFFSIS